jgi:hypothetical protein
MTGPITPMVTVNWFADADDTGIPTVQAAEIAAARADRNHTLVTIGQALGAYLVAGWEPTARFVEYRQSGRIHR